jgi:prevent-host-death family protein
MKIASVADVKARLSAYLRASQEGPVVVTRNGKAVAVLVAVTDEDELERLVLAHSPKFQALLDKSRRQIEETGGIPHDVFWRQVEVASRTNAEKAKPRQRRTKSQRTKLGTLASEGRTPPLPSLALRAKVVGFTQGFVRRL